MIFLLYTYINESRNSMNVASVPQNRVSQWCHTQANCPENLKAVKICCRLKIICYNHKQNIHTDKSMTSFVHHLLHLLTHTTKYIPSIWWLHKHYSLHLCANHSIFQDRLRCQLMGLIRVIVRQRYLRQTKLGLQNQFTFDITNKNVQIFKLTNHLNHHVRQ